MGIVQVASACCVLPGVPPAHRRRIVAARECPLPRTALAGGGSRLVSAGRQGMRFRVLGAPEARAPRGHTSSCVQWCGVPGDDESARHDFYDTRFDITASRAESTTVSSTYRSSHLTRDQHLRAPVLRPRSGRPFQPSSSIHASA